MIRVLITGSRTWDEPQVIANALDIIAADAVFRGKRMTVVHGGARGADRIAGVWARRQPRHRHVTDEVHPADWARYGRRAGMVRNQHMVDLGADLCLAFIKDGSPGATACARMAEQAGIRTQITRSTT